MSIDKNVYMIQIERFQNARKVSRTRLLKNALQRIWCGIPKMDFYKNKHEDCVNFDNGTCRFFHFTNVDPKESACPHFKVKKKPEVEIADTVRCDVE
jgi:hypothetical protein